MAKYSKTIVKKIVGLIKSDRYTITEICKHVRISESTYYDWQKTKLEFSEAIKIANESFISDTLIECERSLVKLIKGYDYDEVRTITVDSGKRDVNNNPMPKIKEQTKTKKHVSPNLGALIHFQTNRDQENWKNRQTNEVTGKGGKDLFSGLTDNQLLERINELERKIKA